MVYCIECGSSSPDNAKFCANCGHAIRFSISTEPIGSTKDSQAGPPEFKARPSGPIFGGVVESSSTKDSQAGPPEFKARPSGPIFGGVVESSSTKDSQAGPPEFRLARIVRTSTPQPEQHQILKSKLEYYRDKLLQLEQRNRSIMLRRIYDKWSFDLSKLVIRGNSPVKRIIEKAFQKKSQICLVSDSDDSELAEKDRTKLRSLYRNLTQLELETGLKEAYFGFPFIVGHVGVDIYVRAPLVLFPISIEYTKDAKPSGWYLLFSKEKPSIVNRALLALLKKKGRITVPESFYEQFEDLSDDMENFDKLRRDSQLSPKQSDQKALNNGNINSIEAYFDSKITDLLSSNGFPLSLSENKLEKIEILESLSRDQQAVMQKEGLHLVNYKILGHFPQGDSAIYSDYEELMHRAESGETDQGIIDNLLEVASPEDLWNEGAESEVGDDIDLDSIPTERLNLVLESDSSQEAAIIAAQSAECTVVRGPPGTGKSQAIVNLIANALADQKKVLLVCQKRAALDVVYQRLSKVGLSKYVALVHDPVNDRKDLYKQLGRLLDYGTSSYTVWHKSKSVDSEIYNTSNIIDKLIATQRAIVCTLSKEYFGGITAHDLYIHAQPGYVRKLDLSSIAPKVQYHELQDLLAVVSKMEVDTKIFDTPDHIWFNRHSFAELGFTDKIRLPELIDEIVSKANSNSILLMPDINQQRELITSLETLSKTTGMFRKFKSSVKDANESARKMINDPRFLSGDSNILESLVNRATHGQELWNSLQKLTAFINETGFSWLASDASVSPLNQAGAPLISWPTKKSFIQLSSSEQSKFLEAINEIVSKANSNSILLMPDINQQRELITSLETLSKTTGMFRKFKSSVKDANESARKMINDPRFLSGDSNILESLVNGLMTVEPMLDGATHGQELWDSLQKLTAFINETGFSWLASDIFKGVSEKEKLITKLEAMKASFQKDFELIHDYDQRKKLLTELQLQVMDICKSKLIKHVSWDKILRQEFYIYWLQIIEQENPVLRRLPFEVYAENCKALASELKKHKLLTTKNISEKINSEIIRPVTTRSGRKTPLLQMWASLASDLDRKRRVLTVRALIQKYESIIFNIAPCWLASPEAVSSIFPLRRNLFDYIVFDEASQSAVERSLTTLYRGNHVVIMGDEKQLRPFNLFRLAEDEEEEVFDETVDENMLSESLLVLAKRTYGNRHLVWHYRSKFQELIDFSNHAFYDGHLQVAPNVLRLPETPPIQWLKCQKGLWEDRQNLPEASLVVNVIKDILSKNEEGGEFRSIGVITFNERQKTAILDEIDRRRKADLEFDKLYESAENPSSKKLDDRPFVKNIENVQGDERDIIIFSVGYARDVDGNLRVQFGTLNQEGGENRLNVAITRARQHIIVVCSIEPEELKTDITKNSGPKRLKDYLQYAKSISEGRIEAVMNLLGGLNEGFFRDEHMEDNNGTNVGTFESTVRRIDL